MSDNSKQVGPSVWRMRPPMSGSLRESAMLRLQECKPKAKSRPPLRCQLEKRLEAQGKEALNAFL
jgi:hypothetical protein